MGAILSILLIPASIYVNGWALATLWNWFIVPTFSAPILSIGMAAGISLVKGMMFSKEFTMKKDEDDRHPLAVMVHRILMCAIAVGIGWMILWLGGR